MQTIPPEIFPGYEGDTKMTLSYSDKVFGIENLFTSVYLKSIDSLVRGEGQNPKSKSRNAMLTVTCMKTCKTISKTYF
jgi:spore maturation protein SpmA